MLLLVVPPSRHTVMLSDWLGLQTESVVPLMLNPTTAPESHQLNQFHIPKTQVITLLIFLSHLIFSLLNDNFLKDFIIKTIYSAFDSHFVPGDFTILTLSQLHKSRSYSLYTIPPSLKVKIFSWLSGFQMLECLYFTFLHLKRYGMTYL